MLSVDQIIDSFGHYILLTDVLPYKHSLAHLCRFETVHVSVT